MLCLLFHQLSIYVYITNVSKIHIFKFIILLYVVVRELKISNNQMALSIDLINRCSYKMKIYLQSSIFNIGLFMIQKSGVIDHGIKYPTFIFQ